MKATELITALERIPPTVPELEKRQRTRGPKPQSGISKSELAARLDITPRTITNWCNGSQPVEHRASLLIEMWAKWNRKDGTP